MFTHVEVVGAYSVRIDDDDFLIIYYYNRILLNQKIVAPVIHDL